MGISNLLDAEFKILIIRMFKELSEDLRSIKEIQSGTKDTLIEIKNNYKPALWSLSHTSQGLCHSVFI